MQYRDLGGTGLTVSRLCFGTLALGPLQGRLSLAAGEELLLAAWERGVNFFDTAELYGTYPYLAGLMREVRGRGREPLLATKSYAWSRQQMQQSLERALDEIGVERVALFLLHEQESALTLAGHREALEFLDEARRRGRVGAVGISTHCIDAVRAATTHSLVDVIHPLINREGLGIKDGDTAAMARAIKLAARAGKGVYAMKALAGGLLRHQAAAALAYVRDLDGVAAVAVGIKDHSELEANLALMAGTEVPQAVARRLGQVPRRLRFEEDCSGCGECIPVCPQGALTLRQGRPVVRREACIVCGYCGSACPRFCIRVV